LSNINPSFLRNTSKLFFGSLTGKIIGIALMPIITRIYLPDDFGTFQLFISIISIISVMSCLSYQSAIVLPDDDNDAFHIFTLCLIITLVFTIFLLIIIYLFGGWITHFLNNIQLQDFLFLIPVAFLFEGFYLAFNYLMIREKQFGLLASSQVLASLGNKGSQFSIGYFINASPLGLIFGYILQNVILILIRLINIKKDISKFKHISINKIYLLSIRYKKFPIFTTWSTFINTIAFYLPVLMLSFFFKPDIVGFFALGNTVIRTPMLLIGNSIARVFFQRVSEEKNRTGDIKGIVQEVYKRLISFGLFPLLVLMLVGEELFIVSFGNSWGEAGVYCQILAPWMLFVMISSPLGSLFSILEKQEVGLLYNIFLLVSRFAVLYVGGIYGDPIIALILFSISGVISYGWLNSYVLKISGISHTEGVVTILKSLYYSLPLIMIILITKLIFHNILYNLLVAFIMTVAYYIMIILKDDYLKKVNFV